MHRHRRVELLLDQCTSAATLGQPSKGGVGEDCAGKGKPGDGPGVESGESTGCRHGAETSDCPEPGGVETGGQLFGFHHSLRCNYVAAVQGDLVPIATGHQRGHRQLSGQIGPYDPISGNSGTGPEHRPRRATSVVPPGSKLGLVPGQVRSAAWRELGPWPAIGIMGPQQTGFGDTPKCGDVTAANGPSEDLGLQVFGRAEKHMVGAGLESQMADESLA